jgi:hypothetical protein
MSMKTNIDKLKEAGHIYIWGEGREEMTCGDFEDFSVSLSDNNILTISHNYLKPFNFVIKAETTKQIIDTVKICNDLVNSSEIKKLFHNS